MTAHTERSPRVNPADQAPHEPISGPRRFRPDIQGLRAVAVLLVVLYHAEVPLVPGGYVGVDVFFVISGFLITGQLVREVRHRGRIHFAEFYLKRVRRLLPPAAVVVIATLLAVRKWGPPLQVTPWSWDAVYTAFYGINYRLAALGIDYQNAQGQVSPFQHFWSLAVEEQFYLIWPLLITALVLLAGRRWAGALVIVLVSSVALSLYISTALLESNAPLAYFSIQSRAWELGVGALLALGASRFARMKPSLAAALSYVGVAAIIASGLWFNDDTAFPGLPATVPVAGAALVILAGCVPVPVGAERALLRWRPMQGVGRVSYSWYLWHWPLVVLMPLIAPTYTFGWVRNLEVMVLALWLATLTYLLVEAATLRRAFKRMSWAAGGLATSAAMIGTALIVVVSMPALVGKGAPDFVVSTATSADPAYLRQVSDQLTRSGTTRAAPRNLTPDLVSAREDYPESRSRGQCLANFLVVDQGDCVFGDTAGTKTMVLVGDSHADQWQPAFAEAGTREQWKVITWTKSACPLAKLSIISPQLGREYTECDDWRAKTVGRILTLKPDLVVIGQSDSVTGKAFTDQRWAEASLEAAQVFTRAQIPVTYMLDTVYPFHDVPDCVTQHLDDVRQCMATGRVDWVDRRHDLMAQTLANAGVPVVEPEPWQCANGFCPAVVGNMLVYRDASHLTATYARWLAPLVQPLLVDQAAQDSPELATPDRGKTTQKAEGAAEDKQHSLEERGRTNADQQTERASATSFSDGQWVLGSDIAPGTYTTVSTDPDCKWAEIASVKNASTFGSGFGNQGRITVKLNDHAEAFATHNCGTWYLR